MRAIGYVRVSTAKQADKGVSLEAQKEKIRAYCALKDMCLTEIVSDAGISGCRTARSGYQKVLAVCGRADVDAVVVYSLSRFTRSTKDLLDFVDTYVSKRGMSLHSLSENLDTGTPTGRFMLKVMAAMNELEREQIGQRTKAALKYKSDKGEKTGGDIPFGYSLGGNGKTLVEDAREQAIITLIEKFNDRGYSYSAIARELNDRGYTTKKGKQWSHVQVKRIITRRAA
jgi:site-specific DNA recombinase